jgi:hypothetical protein
MKITIFISLAFAALVGCSQAALPDAADAELRATEIVGGTASPALQIEEDGHALWQVDVAMANGAHLEVLLFVDSGELFEVKDPAGPFDYALDPLPGLLTYAEAQAIAAERVTGAQVLWEVKWTEGDRYFYEFYVREEGGQLWEIKLWSDDGMIFTVEPKDAVD